MILKSVTKTISYVPHAIMIFILKLLPERFSYPFAPDLLRRVVLDVHSNIIASIKIISDPYYCFWLNGIRDIAHNERSYSRMWHSIPSQKSRVRRHQISKFGKFDIITHTYGHRRTTSTIEL